MGKRVERDFGRETVLFDLIEKYCEVNRGCVCQLSHLLSRRPRERAARARRRSKRSIRVPDRSDRSTPV